MAPSVGCGFCPAGIIAFTDGVSGFNSSSSMHATITEMRTNNISCWIFRAGSRDTASWGWVDLVVCWGWVKVVVCWGWVEVVVYWVWC